MSSGQYKPLSLDDDKEIHNQNISSNSSNINNKNNKKFENNEYNTSNNIKNIDDRNDLNNLTDLSVISTIPILSYKDEITAQLLMCGPIIATFVMRKSVDLISVIFVGTL